MSKAFSIPLTRGFVALVDEEDYDRLSLVNWHALKPKGTRKAWYATRNVPAGDGVPRTSISMHLEILCPLPGYYLDHKDGDGLNNRRSNLRFATNSENCANSGNRSSSSRYKGVSPRNGKWRARICKQYKQINVGHFKEEFDAATAYNFAAEEAFGEFAVFNIPIGVPDVHA